MCANAQPSSWFCALIPESYFGNRLSRGRRITSLFPADWHKLKTAQRAKIWLFMKSRMSLDIVSVSPLVVFNCILGIILLVPGLLLLAPIVQESLR